MNIVVHRGTHQIGGSAIEISTASTRIMLDFGNELSLDEKVHTYKSGYRRRYKRKAGL